MKLPTLVLALILAWSTGSNVRAYDAFNLEDHRGKVVYVDFWASWCTPCRASFPFMQTLSEQHGEALVIAAISVDENRDDAQRFLDQFDVPFKVFFDPRGAQAESFAVIGMPSSYLYNRSGQLMHTHVGFRKKDIDALSQVIADAIYDAE